MNKLSSLILLVLSAVYLCGSEKTKPAAVFPGADETTPSRAQYFSWINNTNEGTSETQTMINLDFFRWLYDEYGMIIDIYAFDAGAIDGKRFYGSMDSERFRQQFPYGFETVYKKAKTMGTRLGIWGGPDGFGETPVEEAMRIEQMVSLCRDFQFALFKFDAVCGPLRPAKEDAFIRMMKACRSHCPDLILLNHRLGLERAQAYATTFLWEGKETYIDVFSTNRVTAPHHRAEAISRGLPPKLQRLTEDHGVCLSSCLDAWDDDLILQAFNRCLILAPQIYANPWLLGDDEFPRLARIYNLHRRYRDILINGKELPKKHYGPYAVSRGDDKTRFITLRNLSWQPKQYHLTLGPETGLMVPGSDRIELRQLHPTERIIGRFAPGTQVPLTVLPFRACLLMATARPNPETGIAGCDYRVIRDTPGKPVLVELLGYPGQHSTITLAAGNRQLSRASIDGQDSPGLLKGENLPVIFPGQVFKNHWHRSLGELSSCPIPQDAEALYEASCFAADSNALEVRSLYRSGPTAVPQVQAARDAFFNQEVFTKRGVWDRNLFDGDPATGFWPTRKYRIDQRVQGGCLRLDLGELTDIDRLVLVAPDEYSLQPLLRDEAYEVEGSADLRTWHSLKYLARERMVIDIPAQLRPIRYFRFSYYPDRLVEIEGFRMGRSLPRDKWRASNLLAPTGMMKPVKAFRGRFIVDEWINGSYLCIAIEGKHGIEGAVAAVKVNGRYMGCPDRAPSYPSNTWEYVNARRDRNYTYYLPVTQDMIGRPIDVYVLAYDKKHTRIKPRVWQTAFPIPYAKLLLELQ